MTSSPMRIGIDGMNLAILRGTGVATYARTLSHCVGELGHRVDVVYGLNIAAAADPALREIQFFDLLESERGRKPPKFPSVSWARDMIGARAGLEATQIELSGRTIATPLAPRLPHYDRILNVQDLFGLAGRYFRNFGRFLRIRIPDAPAIMHWTYPLPIKVIGSKNIYTVHDVVPLRMPYTTLDNKELHFRLLDACFRQADHVVTVSETSRRDILSFFPALSPERITNTYQAVMAPHLRGGRRDRGDRARCVRAGVPRLLPVFRLDRTEEKCGPPARGLSRFRDHDEAGHRRCAGVEIRDRACAPESTARPMTSASRQIDYLPNDMLAVLIAGARGVVFPSLYEGFGLPVLEAMSLGTAVLTSREGSLPEIAGEAALLVDPYDPSDIGAGLLRLAQDDELCAELGRRGLTQAARFGMMQYRERVSALYRTVLHGTTEPTNRRTAAR